MANLKNVVRILESIGIEAEEKMMNKNGITLEVVVIGSGVIRPVLYNNQSTSDKELVMRCVETIENGTAQVDQTDFTDWNKAKDNLYLYLRRATGDGAVTESFLDLELVCCVQFKVGEEMASVNVNEHLLRALGVCREKLFHVAERNTFSKFTAESMEHKMARLMYGTESDDEIAGATMVVISNDENYRGASLMLDTAHLKEVADIMCSDLYILPSSIHEVIVVPTDAGAYISDLESMVKEINESEVAPEEVLGNTIYKFSREDMTITYA